MPKKTHKILKMKKFLKKSILIASFLTLSYCLPSTADVCVKNVGNSSVDDFHFTFLRSIIFLRIVSDPWAKSVPDPDNPTFGLKWSGVAIGAGECLTIKGYKLVKTSPPQNSILVIVDEWWTLNGQRVDNGVKYDDPDTPEPPVNPGEGYGFQAIPEPLTILGSATALGFGAFFKRKLKSS